MTRSEFDKLKNDGKFGVCSYNRDLSVGILSFSNGYSISIKSLTLSELDSLIKMAPGGQEAMLEFVIDRTEKLNSKPVH